MDVDVFKQRFLPFHPKLYRIAYALLDNKADAEDILQDAYCKLWNKRDELGDIQNPEAFSITLVKNLCLDFLRSPKASRRDNEEALETVLLTTDSSPEKELEEKEDIRHIQELIEQLPENQRQVIRLRGIEDCSYEDIEQITGLSSSNIRTLLSRARKLIREKLEKASCHGDELINKALQEDLALPEGLSERLERRIDFLAQEEVSPRVSRRRSFYWISGIAAAILGALFLIFTETNHPAPVMADTFTDPKEAAVVAQNALAFMSRNLNKGLGQVNEAGQENTKINKIVNKHLND